MEALIQRINKYNQEVKGIFNFKINGKRWIPHLLKSYQETYNEMDITELKELLDQQLIRYEKIMTLLDGYMLGSGKSLQITHNVLDFEFIPNLPKDLEFLLGEYEFDKKAYPAELISTLHITEVQ